MKTNEFEKELGNELEKELRRSKTEKRTSIIAKNEDQIEKELKEFEETKNLRFLNCVCLLSYLQCENILEFKVSNKFCCEKNDLIYFIETIRLLDFSFNSFTKNLDSYYIENLVLSTDYNMKLFNERENYIHRSWQWYDDWKKEQERLEQVKVNALSKLNDEEKKLLGLKN